MSGKLFLKNHLPVILLNLLGALALSLFLLAVGNDIQTVLFILTAWMLVLALYLAAGYVSRKKRLEKLLEMAGQLKERYLLPEVMPVPDQAEEQVYYQLLKMAGKSMLERIGEVERERGEYRTYIEQWVHEVKTRAGGAGEHQPLCGAGPLLRPQRAHREGLLHSGDETGGCGAWGHRRQ